MEDYLNWLYRHMALECVQLDERGDLIQLACAAPENIPRLYIARHHEKYHIFFRHDIPFAIRDTLLARSAESLMSQYELVNRVFQESGLDGSGEIWRGKSYVYLPKNQMIYHQIFIFLTTKIGVQF